MNLSKELEQYILEYSDNESELLKELSRETEHKILLSRMLSGHIQGRVLSMISKMIKPDYILELGTYTGYSAICLAEGLTENGKLHTIEINDELETFTRHFFKKAQLEEKIILHIGNAIEIIKSLPDNIDLSFIDADKRQYPQYYDLIINKTRLGGFILADNVLWNGKVLKTPAQNDQYTAGIIEFNKMVKNDNRVEKIILPIRDGITLMRKVKN